ncbi:hypothetical protein [Longimicrobium terrae]|uniref:Uncharacterized protein n=1 Tax=Longimicrobium terrae TaxID=1639882 RepID=A0A841GLU6_9BACT|nr:hypothetical protein [Longimicrobium terrae]MBB4635173.1 hypothetical protein [Longimicrobium terrae]MBB6069567.1 hypothetical protein [Longimicrobium terrae]NNC31630.1 hypothetical protein [Longimicrobium terrae]
MRKVIYALSLLACVSAPLAAQVDNETGGDLKEYDVTFDKNGNVICFNTGTKCTAAG